MRFMLVEHRGPCPTCGEPDHRPSYWHIVDTHTGTFAGHQQFEEALATATYWERYPPKNCL